MEGPDHAASLEFEEFSLLVEGIREIEIALGSSNAKSVFPRELINRENLGKSIVAKTAIKERNYFKKASSKY